MDEIQRRDQAVETELAWPTVMSGHPLGRINITPNMRCGLPTDRTPADAEG